jgi:hypothetical protein
LSIWAPTGGLSLRPAGWRPALVRPPAPGPPGLDRLGGWRLRSRASPSPGASPLWRHPCGPCPGARRAAAGAPFPAFSAGQSEALRRPAPSVLGLLGSRTGCNFLFFVCGFELAQSPLRCQVARHLCSTSSAVFQTRLSTSKNNPRGTMLIVFLATRFALRSFVLFRFVISSNTLCYVCIHSASWRYRLS